MSNEEDGIRIYRRTWPPGYSSLDVELVCFRHGLTEAQGGLGKAEHWWRIVEMLWPVGSVKGFIRNPWSEKMIEEACRWQYLSVSGPASASKTDTFALWAIVNFIASPANTLVLITSTSLSESRMRCWGSVEDHFRAVPGLPGKLVSAIGMIRYEDNETGERGSDRCGIKLISGDKKHEKGSIEKIIGIKNDTVILIGDELPELSPSLIEGAKANLSSNPHFQFIGIGNPKSPFDVHGILSTPKKGWKSITPLDEEWETDLGYAIRFDGERSPNILLGKIVFPFLPTKAWIEKQKQDLGENSLSYWRMVRGFWCPEGASEGVYSDADITSSGAEERAVKWTGSPITVAGQDPGWTNGGDETILQFGLFGRCEDGYDVLLFTDRVKLFHDTTNPKPRNYQIAQQTKEQCVKRGVRPENFGFDATGAGSPYGDILAETWSAEVYRVEFGGAATAMPVGTVGAKPANQLFADRTSELWFAGKDFIRSLQIKGIDADMARDLTCRRGTTIKRQGLVMRQVESKKDTRKRVGRSPDKGEAGLILLDLCRQKLHFRSQVIHVVSVVAQRKWRSFVAGNEEFERSAITTLAQTDEEVKEQRKLTQPANRSYMTERPMVSGSGWGGEDDGLR